LTETTLFLPGAEASAFPWVDRLRFRSRDGVVGTLKQTLVQSEEALGEMLEATSGSSEVVYDSETSGLHPALGALICGHAVLVRLNEHELQAWYVPVRHLATTEPQIDPELAADALRAIMAKRDGVVVGHHLKFDALMLRADGVEIEREWDDTIVRALIRDENEPSFALKNLGAKYCLKSAKDEEDSMDAWMRQDAHSLGMHYKKRGKKTPDEPSYLERFGYARAPITLAGRYACMDVLLTYLLRRAFASVSDTYPSVYKRDVEISKELMSMEWEGLPVNKDEIKRVDYLIGMEADHWLGEIRGILKDPTFVLTDANMRTLFYEQLRMTPPKTTAAGKLSVDRESRQLLASGNPQHKRLLDAISSYQKALKIKSTYAGSFLKFVSPDGRICGSYNQLEQRDEGGLPVTGRLSSANPNVQNIAKKPFHLFDCSCKKCAEIRGILAGEEKTVSIRRYFVVPEGYAYVYIDLSQIELRVLAWLSRDPVLMDCYAKGLDVHKLTADAVTGGNRDIAKQVNFGNNYGMTEIGLAKRLPYYFSDPDRALRDAAEYLKRFFETYAGVPKFKRWLARQMRGNGDAFVSPFGRPRRIPTISSNEEHERLRAERMMMSSIVSGTAADLIKEIMLRCRATIREDDLPVKMLQCIHDEIVFSVPIPRVAEALPTLHRCFTDWPMFSDAGIPIEASIELTTTTWEDKRALELVPGGFRWAA